jgi:hypothetical protein
LNIAGPARNHLSFTRRLHLRRDYDNAAMGLYAEGCPILRDQAAAFAANRGRIGVYFNGGGAASGRPCGELRLADPAMTA